MYIYIYEYYEFTDREREIQIIACPPNPISSLTPLLSFGRPANLAVDMSGEKCRGASQIPMGGTIRPCNAKGPYRNKYTIIFWTEATAQTYWSILSSQLPFLIPSLMPNPLELPHGVFPRTMVKWHYESPCVFSHTSDHVCGSLFVSRCLDFFLKLQVVSRRKLPKWSSSPKKRNG